MLATDQKRSDALTSVAAIMEPVSEHMAALTRFLDGQVESFEPEVRDMVRYCLVNQGKRIRPMLLFFSNWAADGSVNHDAVRAAAVVELVHLATLVHDDILDDADIRHNSDTVSAKWGPHVAVLLGDALFAQALNLASDFPTVEVCRAVSASTRRVCAGEIRQTFERGNAALSLDDYFHVIDLKTAELFKVSCFLGAHLAGFEPAVVEAYAEFGRRLGVAYQIFDDMADILGDETKIGKTLGTDLASGKYTLPLILLQHRVEGQAKEALNAAKQSTDANTDQSAVIESLQNALRDLGIQEEVSERFEAELAAGDAALAPYVDRPSAQRLLSLSKFVRTQMGRIAPAS
ncbi:polyprenyl synthetase family protein [Cerasicoccus fimbriatus]|uniref:polyprenyl synthetase family protein n=1 Tax=Cerasicoccus fimbriatus TaxID=3014554 RepID=UPI0022B48037|nr:polyprenyl synthetase family protein [Cerasicoccus sp. TK19100]